MKLDELFNNYGKMYFNVLPPTEVKPNSSKLIASVLRAKADSQGNEENAQGQGSSRLWPNHKWDRRQKDDTAKAIVQRSKKLLKKNRNADHELELVTDKNRQARDEQTGGVYR